MSQIYSYLKEFKSDDNDFRYMGVNDLLNDLNRSNFEIEHDLANMVIEGLLELLEAEQSISEVKNISIKCLGALTPKLNEKSLELMFSKLYEHLNSKKDENVELAGLALKTIVGQLKTGIYTDLVEIKNLLVRLINTLIKSTNYTVQHDVLEIINELLLKFDFALLNNAGGTPDNEIQAPCLSVIFPLLGHKRSGIRKKASICLGSLAKNLKQSLFDELVNKLYTLFSIQNITQLQDKQTEQIIVITQSFSMLFRSDPVRSGVIIKNVLPTIIHYMSFKNESLTEVCLQCLEMIVLFCPKEAEVYIKDITNVALEYVSYDPNYVHNEDEDDTIDEDNEFDDEDDEFADEFSDDDDNTWKIRRLCAKLFKALISVNTKHLKYFYETVVPTLIKRISEREESVRIEIIQTFILLLQNTHFKSNLSIIDIQSQGVLDDENNIIKHRKVVTPKADDGINNDNDNDDIQSILLNNLSKIVKKISDQVITSNSLLTQQVCISFLSQLTLSIPSLFNDHLDTLNNILTATFNNNQLNKKANFNHLSYSIIKKKDLNFIKQLLLTHKYEVFDQHISWLCSIILNSITDGNLKSPVEAYLACIELIKVILPIDLNGNLLIKFEIHSKYCKDIYNTLIGPLKETVNEDTDNSKIERSIKVLGILFHHSGDNLINELENSISILYGLVLHDNYGLFAIQTISTILNTKLFNWNQIEKGSSISNTFINIFKNILSNFKKNNRNLRNVTLNCVYSLIFNFGNHFELNLFNEFSLSIKELLANFELQELKLSILILESMISPNLNNTTRQYNIQLLGKDALWLAIVNIPTSPHLQGEVTDKFTNLLKNTIITLNEFNMDIDTISKYYIDAFLKPVTDGIDSGLQKQTFSNLSRCITSVIMGYNQCINSGYTKFIELFTKVAQDVNAPVNNRHLSFIVLGYLSLKFDLSNDIDLFSTSLKGFEDKNSELRTAAAFALGCYTASNLNDLLPELILQVESTNERYLLLLSLKEVISYYVNINSNTDNSVIHPYYDDLWRLLVEDSNNINSKEESTLNLIAECIGKLTLMNPNKFLPMLKQKLSSDSSNVRLAVIISTRYTYSNDILINNIKKFINLLKPYIADFLSLLKDENLIIRRQSLLTLTSISHQMPTIINNILPDIINYVYSETLIKKELIHIIEMGLSKLKVDDGLENRKAAYECIYSLLDTHLNLLDLDKFINDYLLLGLNDEHEIRLICHLILLRIIKLAPNRLIRHLEVISQILKQELEAKVVKANDSKQDQNKREEMSRSIYKLIASFEVNLKVNIPVAALDTLLAKAKEWETIEHYNEALRAVSNYNA